MWPRKDLTDLLGIEHPILQAPMAGSTTPALAAAVSNAGGLGALGCASLGVEELHEQAGALRKATNRAFNLNFFVHETEEATAEQIRNMTARLAPYFEELDAGDVPAPEQIFPPFGAAMLDALLALRPRVASFHFGLPGAEAMAALKAAGIIVMSSATTVAEAKALEAGGADAIVAQGSEAGGHRGTFLDGIDGGTVGTFALVPQVADAVSVPVIAAGGIADGRGIAAAFALGASGVQIGTAFLNTPEAATNDLHRAALLAAEDGQTKVTKVISGRPARGLVNRYMAEMADREEDSLPFPLQYSVTRPLQAASRERGSDAFLSLWAGQAVALNRVLPAADLVGVLVEETRAALASLRFAQHGP